MFYSYYYKIIQITSDIIKLNANKPIAKIIDIPKAVFDLRLFLLIILIIKIIKKTIEFPNEKCITKKGSPSF